MIRWLLARIREIPATLLQLVLARLGITITTAVTPEQLTVIVIDTNNKYIAINRRYKTIRISWRKHDDKLDTTLKQRKDDK